MLSNIHSLCSNRVKPGLLNLPDHGLMKGTSMGVGLQFARHAGHHYNTSLKAANSRPRVILMRKSSATVVPPVAKLEYFPDSHDGQALLICTAPAGNEPMPKGCICGYSSVHSMQLESETRGRGTIQQPLQRFADECGLKFRASERCLHGQFQNLWN